MAENKAELVGEYFKLKILEFKSDLQSMVIFGSWAAGEGGRASDVDLLLVFDTLDDSDEQWLSKLKFETSLKFGTSIDVVPLTKEDFELNVGNKMPLFLEIWKKHKISFDTENYFKSKIEAIGALVKTGKIGFYPWISCWVTKS